MQFEYGRWDGEDFPTQDRLDLFDRVLDFVMTYGEPALESLSHADLTDEQRQWLDQLIQDGLLEKMSGRWKLTPRAISRMQRRALSEVFAHLRAGTRDGHTSEHTGAQGERTDGTRPYQFGDSVSQIDPIESIRNAMRKQQGAGQVKLSYADLAVYQTESQTSVSTVILLDQSGSMARFERYANAKKCAMALHALIGQQFPFDTVDVIGFSSGAEIIPDRKLPLSVPKRVSIFDPVVRMRIPLDQIGDGPQHFTNLHLGLTMARQMLARRGGENKQIFIITDGEPTAHVEDSFVHLLYPPDKRSAIATLKEASRCASQGIRLATFALVDDYQYMEWVGFVDQMTRLTRGVSFYCASGDLADCVVESYLTGRRVRKNFT